MTCILGVVNLVDHFSIIPVFNMGILVRTLPLIAGGAVASAAAAVTIATRHIRPTPLSALDPSSLVTRFTTVPNQHVDVYEVTLDQATTITAFARAFFQSPLFRAERVVLNLVGVGGAKSDDAIDALLFAVGDNVAHFTVFEATPTELLFGGRPEVNAHSWLAVSNDGRQLRFGSTIQSRPLVRLLTPVHLVYAQLVLASAKYQLETTAAVDKSQR
ncbi:Aste57867_25354 [Aphanomyces stellatus]|uniref:Aste57867_25354 protein n=1 Tax=Aphanomyces stellatus TaxID=120398 RepID=A0A485LT20_9STRA|nr:hypothetical protein As57867_025276 [Aphanomyces stellatus]VFU01979.1 Aste57867_25354 [Aphanomyces stellatus]